MNEREYTEYYESWFNMKERKILSEKDLYKPIVGRLSPNSPQPPLLSAYLSIFHSGAEVPIGTFAKDGDNGYLEAISGLLGRGALAVKLREDGVAVVYARPIEPMIKFEKGG